MSEDVNPSDARSRKGDAFAIWGDKPNERCMIHSSRDMNGILRELASRGNKRPLAALFGSSFGDLVFVVFSTHLVHVSAVLAGTGDCVSAKGNPARTEALPAKFPVLQKDVPLTVANYVATVHGQAAIKELVMNGDVSDVIVWNDAIEIEELRVELPKIMRERALVAPLDKSMPPFSASDLRKST